VWQDRPIVRIDIVLFRLFPNTDDITHPFTL